MALGLVCVTQHLRAENPCIGWKKNKAFTYSCNKLVNLGQLKHMCPEAAVLLCLPVRTMTANRLDLLNIGAELSKSMRQPAHAASAKTLQPAKLKLQQVQLDRSHRGTPTTHRWPGVMHNAAIELRRLRIQYAALELGPSCCLIVAESADTCDAS